MQTAEKQAAQQRTSHAAKQSGALLLPPAARCAPGWFCGLGVIERSMGAAGAGAVRVGAGAWNVRVPRLPKPPPPRRASAS